MKKVKKIATMLLAMCIIYMSYGMTAYATPKLISGTQKLAQDGTTWLTGIIAAVTTVMALFKGFKWQTADEEEKPRAAKGVKNTLIVGVVLTCMSGLITLVLGYYS